MNVMIRFLRRLVRDASGASIIEYALLLTLVAAVASFGMIVLGDALSQFYSDAGGALFTETEMAMPRCVEVDSNCRAGR